MTVLKSTGYMHDWVEIVGHSLIGTERLLAAEHRRRDRSRCSRTRPRPGYPRLDQRNYRQARRWLTPAAARLFARVVMPPRPQTYWDSRRSDSGTESVSWAAAEVLRYPYPVFPMTVANWEGDRVLCQEGRTEVVVVSAVSAAGEEGEVHMALRSVRPMEEALGGGRPYRDGAVVDPCREYIMSQYQALAYIVLERRHLCVTGLRDSGAIRVVSMFLNQIC